MKPGDTLSQIGLARHFGCTVSAIHAEGNYVTMANVHQQRETWARQEYANGRGAGYRLINVARIITVRLQPRERGVYQPWRA